MASQDSQDWRGGTRKYQKPCLVCNDKSNFTTILRASIVLFLLISRGYQMLQYKKPKVKKAHWLFVRFDTDLTYF